MVQAAIRWALMNQKLGVVLVGFSETAQLEEAATASNGQTISQQDLDAIEELYRSDFGLRTVA
jgi:aryl-alcohol dehydrogenase-like predicted oxidoreductase